MATTNTVTLLGAGLTRRRLLALGATLALPFLTGGDCTPRGGSLGGASFEDAKPALRAKFGNLSSAELFLKWDPMSHAEVIKLIDDYNRKERAKRKAPAGGGSEGKTGDGGGGGGGGGD
jgi:hypothetical protein